MNILEVKNLSTYFFTDDGVVKAADNVSFSLNKGETLAIVGESGSGKSVTSLSIMRLINYPGKITNGEIIFKNEDLLKLSNDRIRKIRGNNISIIFQDPFTSLNPVFTVGEQLTEAVMLHKKLNKEEALEKAVEALKKVRISSAVQRMKCYPHELSGGMRQRVMIAMGIICGPEILIADEPTTALDATIQAQILDLMRQLKKEIDTSVILITHNLGIVANFCEKVIVMYAGNIVEEAPVYDIFNNPKHPYTKALLECLPRLSDSENAGARHPSAEFTLSEVLSFRRRTKSNVLRTGRTPLPSIKGQPPNLINLPPGCRFAPRCLSVMDICKEKNPDMIELTGTRKVRCWLYGQ